MIEVGLVPKFLAVTPNDKYLLVSNWCSYNLSVVDIATGKQVALLPMGAYPRGIAISPDSATAYVAIMGSDIIQKVDLDNLTLGGSFYVGVNPRHVVIDPDGKYLYVSLNAPGEVVKVDIATERVVATRQTGDQCRSLAISTDGTALYVVNYLSDTVSLLRASDLAILQTVPTGVRPIGITYDAMTGDVWVAVYTGQILVFAHALSSGGSPGQRRTGRPSCQTASGVSRTVPSDPNTTNRSNSLANQRSWVTATTVPA